MGFPIRKSPDQSLFAAPRRLSQRITSFIACAYQGIHQMPLRHLIALITDDHLSPFEMKIWFFRKYKYRTTCVILNLYDLSVIQSLLPSQTCDRVQLTHVLKQWFADKFPSSQRKNTGERPVSRDFFGNMRLACIVSCGDQPAKEWVARPNKSSLNDIIEQAKGSL